MGKEVASLYATLGIQDKGFKNALKDANTGLGQVGKGFEKITGVSLKTATAWGVAATAGTKLIDFIKQSVSETEAYVTAMTEGAHVTGMTVEEYSRFTQVADDLFLSQEKLKTIMDAAARQGTDLTIPGIKKLSQEYNSLSTSQEKAKFTAENFGRTGLEMYKVLELSGEELESAMASVSDSLVVTNQTVQDIENYKRSVDNLSDSWQGVKYTVGMEVIPELDLLLRVLTPGKDAVEQNAQAVNLLEERISRLAGAAAMGNDSAKARIEELELELANLKDGSTDTATNGIDFLSASVVAASTYFQELTKQLVFNIASQGLSDVAALELAVSMGLVNESTATAIGELQDIQAEYANTGNLDAYIGKVTHLGDSIDNIKSKTVLITVDTQVTGNGAQYIGLSGSIGGAGKTYTGLTDEGSNKRGPGGANGLDFIVPPGYPNDSYPIRVQSGEHVEVTPAGKSSGISNAQLEEILQRMQPDYNMISRIFTDAVSRVSR